MSNATLLIIQGTDQGARFEIQAAEVGLGRGAHNELRIHDTEASRSHAVLSPAEGTYLLTDLRSANGTYVNGRPVTRQLLTHGDRIQIGRTILLYAAPESSSVLQQLVDRIDLVPEHDPEDRANIVGEASPQEADALVTLSQSAALQSSDRSLQQTLANLQVLYRITEEAVRPSISLDQMLGRILDLIIESTGADRGCMLLCDVQTGDLAPHVFRFRRGVDGNEKMPVSRTIVDYVVQNRQGVRSSDARTDTRFIPGQSILQGGIREAICVPMQGRHELLGVIYVDISTAPERAILDSFRGGKFNEDLLRLMVAIGRQTALAVEDNRFEQAYVKAERLAAVGQTITILSHHIKNILQGVRGGSFLIDMGLKEHNEDLIRKGWNIVEKNQGKIYHLVMDMLTFSKERQPALQRGDVNTTVAEVCELMQARAAELGVQFQWNLAPGMPTSSYDPEGIHRALLNIVTNALDAVEGGDSPIVTVQTGHDPATRSVFITVSDNGPGIPSDRLQHIFNLFESTKGSRGTGIGLAVSQKILREHGGDVAVASQPEQGARFTLEWPIMEEESVGSQTYSH